MLDDDSIYEAGRDLAMAGRYGEAIEVLGLAADKTDPRILNYLGYSHRKSGRIQVGLGYYQEALRIDPDYTLVREYLGEAYLQLGDVASARNQLSEIEKRCGTGCSEYAIAGRTDRRIVKLIHSNDSAGRLASNRSCGRLAAQLQARRTAAVRSSGDLASRCSSRIFDVKIARSLLY